MISVQNLWQKFHLGKDEVVAVSQVSFDVFAGEFVSLTGSSGSGKSTLLHLIGGLCRPTRGEVIVNGQLLNRMSENQLAVFRRQHLGFIFQTFNLLPSLTALENVTMPLVFAEIAPAERRRRAIKILQLVGLAHRLEHKPSELSGGQQQRVSIARALVNNPVLVLADEPTGNLDSRTGDEIMGILTDINRREGCTILLVTHDAEAARSGHRIIGLRDGKIETIETIAGFEEVTT
ncbi:MAG: ABC transporter ATP-binding protein [Dethiobacteraceae bacterium]